MKLKIILIIIASFIFNSCSVFRSDNKNYLWKVEDEDSFVYLLGSIHLGKSEFFPLDSAIENAYKKTDYIAIELNTDNVNPSEIMLKGVYSGDSTLRDKLSPTSFEKISAILDNNNIPRQSYMKFKPWLAVMTATQLELSKTDYSQNYGIDNYFIKKAKSDRKEILELESFEEQIEALSSLDNMADEYFEYSLDEMKNTKKNIDKMYKYWFRGDTSGVAKFIDAGEDEEGYELFNKKFITDRNRKITNKINTYLDDNKKVLIIFGAGHFTGKNGVLNLLNAEKYKITQK